MSVRYTTTTFEPPTFSIKKGELSAGEIFWRERFNWFRDQGYVLRDRYKPDWVPSWDPNTEDPRWKEAEDALPFQDTRVPDAVRVSDQAVVVLKVLNSATTEHEEAVATLFSSEPLASDPRNHCVPIYDVLSLPGKSKTDRVLVMPMLREYDDPSFDTVGEVVAMFCQVFEGLHFMHLHHTAHRDCTKNNIMMDASVMYPEPFHYAKPEMRRDLAGRAKYYTRTQRPPKYYLIDFGHACTFNPEDGPPRIHPRLAGDRTLPEFEDSTGEPYDPFPADVYYIGNWIQEWFIKKYHGFEFMQPLVVDMVQRDPAKRPTMDQVVQRYDKIVKRLSSWRLRSRVVKRSENIVVGAYRSVGHWKRRVLFTATAVPSVPVPARPATS